MENNMKTILFLLLVVSIPVLSQDDFSYKTPPKEIENLVMTKPSPTVSVDSKGEWLLLMERSSFPSIEELAEPELRIAGVRINPENFGPSRSYSVNGFRLKNIKSGQISEISGLPENLKASSIQWSPSESKIAFINSSSTAITLWIIDVQTQSCKQLTTDAVNAVIGESYKWAGDESILFKAVFKPRSALTAKPPAPSGPVVQENTGGLAASRTYQDLIKSTYDETLFEFYTTVQLKKLELATGKTENLGSPIIASTMNLSPDKKFILVRELDKPFSYLVPWSGFPHSIKVFRTEDGSLVKILAKNPTAEGQPIGFDDAVNYPRNFDWRDDLPSTVTFVQALDKGLGRSKAVYRDALMAVDIAAASNPVELFKTTRRMGNITWGNNQTAIFYERTFSDRKQKMNLFNPSTGKVDSLYERSTNDAYSDIGSPLTVKNNFDKQVLLIKRNGRLLLRSSGSSDEGDMPFVAEFDIKNQKSNIIWRCKAPYYEYVADVLDAESNTFLTSRESTNEVANYYIVTISGPQGKVKEKRTAITNFSNPYPQLAGIAKQKISYERSDGINLTGDLYLPAKYNKEKDGPLPVIIWAYPREYKSAADAAQVRGSKYTFTRINYGSPIFWVTQGYAVLDNAEMPIVGEGNEPNDNFIPQLYLNAHSAIQQLAKMGVGDSNRVAVGGHSYGAFMTANLLAHTKLFKAGIARSGAYNRTLTPFGFQAEERTYWQAPEVYFNMSPFSFANQIKTPLLLIHGDADNNSGTFPIQSERLFNAVKGHGGIVRYVSLPYESHGYAAKENILHMLWEQNQWLEKHVKNSRQTPPPAGEEKKAF